MTQPEFGKLAETFWAETKMPEPIMMPRNRLTVFHSETFLWGVVDSIIWASELVFGDSSSLFRGCFLFS